LLDSPTRPGRFTRPSSTDFENYDTQDVGWKYRVASDPDPAAKSAPMHEAHFIFDTSRYGLSNRGHTFGDRLTQDQRIDLIEYLKTL
jgi:hypothetical protein